MNEERALSDLEYIRNVMHMVRRRNTIDGIYYVIWGLVIPLCTTATLILARTAYAQAIGFVWMAGMLIGVVSCFIAGWLRGKNRQPEAPGRELMMYYTTWILFAIVYVIVVIVGWGFGKLTVPQALFILGLLLGFVYALDATFSGLRWMYLLSAGWLVSGTIAVFLPMETASIVFGFGTVPLELLPGLVLNRIYRQDKNGTT